jgi:hypothetical protein
MPVDVHRPQPVPRVGSRGSLIVGSDAAATARTVLVNEALFRAGLAADLAMLAYVATLPISTGFSAPDGYAPKSSTFVLLQRSRPDILKELSIKEPT